MLKAKLDSVRKNKKGFSLVELIIVIAIMVALIAVMAPSFVKYVQKSRDSALATAAESLYTAMQTYYGDPEEDPDAGVTLYVWAKGGESIGIGASFEGTTITGSDAADASDAQRIVKIAGVDTSKTMGKASVYYELKANAPTGSSADTGYTFSMTKHTATFSTGS